MLAVEKYGIIISPTDLEFENMGTFNPGTYQEGNTVHHFYRATQIGNISTIGYAKSDGPTKIIQRDTKPLINIDFDYEIHGVEDPRIVKIEDIYYLTYTAYDGSNTMGALATSKDLIHFEKQGIITPRLNYKEYEDLISFYDKTKLNPKYHDYYNLFAEIGIIGEKELWLRDKDLVFFPRKINGKFALLHRLWPGIQIVYFDHWSDLTKSFWEDYIKNLIDYIVLDPKISFEVRYIGAGCAPIETDDGWLLIYHGVEETSTGKMYHGMAALLQIEKPEIEISRLNFPILSPTKVWEKTGVVDNVVFPTGHAIFDDDLYIYYGAADKHTAVAKLNINELLLELRRQI